MLFRGRYAHKSGGGGTECALAYTGGLLIRNKATESKFLFDRYPNHAEQSPRNWCSTKISLTLPIS